VACKEVRIEFVGMVTRCPGYVDVTVDDWSTSEELFHYELAVSCPPRFNATFYLPHRALAGTSNRTFLVTLDDSEQRYQVFLTAVQHSTHTDDTQGQSPEVVPMHFNSQADIISKDSGYAVSALSWWLGAGRSSLVINETLQADIISRTAVMLCYRVNCENPRQS